MIKRGDRVQVRGCDGLIPATIDRVGFDAIVASFPDGHEAAVASVLPPLQGSKVCRECGGPVMVSARAAELVMHCAHGCRWSRIEKMG